MQIPNRWVLTFILIAIASFPVLGQTQETPAPQPVLRRWIDLQAVNLNIRYRYADNTDDQVTTNLTQHREAVRARVKFDPAGRYALTIAANTGVRFSSSWNNTGWGAAAAQARFDVRGLYVEAQPVRALEAQVGGIYFVRGQSTEITSYDEDGFLTGARVIARAPAVLFFHEVSVTRAYLTADSSQIPVSRRLRHIDEPNYAQFLVDRKLGARAEFSVDYTTDRDVETWHEAVNVSTPELRFADSIRLELYERTSHDADHGFAVTAEKTVRPWAFNGGFASVDPEYGGLNADRFQSGKRVFGMVTYAISPDLLASVFVTTLVGDNPTLPQRTLSNLIVTYNALPTLRRTGLF